MRQLDKERIACAALDLIEEQGPKGFTMRAVASKLGVSPMALYHHTRDKTDLIRIMADKVSRERVLAPPTGPWREDLYRVASWSRAHVLKYPHLIDLQRTHGIWSANAGTYTERWLTPWMESGLERENALLAAMAFNRVVMGVISEENAFNKSTSPADAASGNLHSARSRLHDPGQADRIFELAVRSFIDGIHDRLSSGGD